MIESLIFLEIPLMSNNINYYLIKSGNNQDQEKKEDDL